MGKDVLWTKQWKKQRERVLRRDNYTCMYCGQEATQVDHIIPRKRGGGHDLDNLVACCAPCNSRKGALEEGVFLTQSVTPPVFQGNLSPRAASVIPENPFVTETKPIIN
jgi:5-methylcytosine-specific restriction endonuclease McrA